MIRNLMLLLMLALSVEAQATYTVTVSKQPYADLTGATALVYSPTDSGYYFNTPFMFRTFRDHYANFNIQMANPVSAGAFLDRRGAISIYDSIGKRDVVVFQIFENERFTINPDITSASAKLEGTAGNRILKFEYNNLVYNGVNRHLAKFQVWLHEADGSVSYHYGLNSLPMATSIADGGFTGIVVVKGDASRLLDEINLEGRPTTPVIYRDLPGNTGMPTLDTIPPSGTVYTFRPSAVGVETSRSAAEFAVHPNPTAGELRVLAPEDGQLQLLSMDGRLLASLRLRANAQTVLDLRDFPSGAYCLRYTTAAGVSSRLVQKQ